MTDTSIQHGVAYIQAKAANESIKAQKTRRQLQRLQQRYIDRVAVEAHVTALANDSRARWQAWVEPVSAALASALSVDRNQLAMLLYAGVVTQCDELGSFTFRLSVNDAVADAEAST